MGDEWNDTSSSNGGGFGGGGGSGFGGPKSDNGGGFGSNNDDTGGFGGGFSERGGHGGRGGRGRRGGGGRGGRNGFDNSNESGGGFGSGGGGGGFGSGGGDSGGFGSGGGGGGGGFGSGGGGGGGFGGGGGGGGGFGSGGGGGGGFGSGGGGGGGFGESDGNSEEFGDTGDGFRGRGRGRGRGGRGRGRGRGGGGFGGGDDDTGGGGGGFGGEDNGGDQEGERDPDRPAPVTYVPPEPSEAEEEMFRTIAQGINFDNYDNIPVEVSGPANIPGAIRSFTEAGLPETIIENIKKAKYNKPTPVQKYAIPIVSSGNDLMACAQTGSGKTAAFLLPVLSGIMEHREELTSQLSEVQAPLGLIIAPTRELASQIYNEARKFAFHTNIRPVVVYGGVSVAHHLRQVEAGCHLLVGTPGRLKDFIQRRKISLEKLRYLILDEADRMLDMGFMPDVKTIVSEYDMPSKKDRRTLMFSATFPEQIQTLAGEFLNDQYVFVTIGKIGSTHSGIEQTVLEIDDSSKRDKLVEILSSEGGNRNLVFVQTKRLADFLASYLCQNGFPTTSIHGDRYQQQREEALREFKSGQQTVLIATAVAARGLDIADVKQVINYDLPDEIEEYIHRIGRTGRIGNKGKAVSFFSRSKDEALARALVKTLADAEQEVPDWLEDVAETALGTGYGPKGGRFASKDARDSRGGGGGGGRFNAAGNNDGWDSGNTANGGDVNSSSGGGGEESWD